jgi:putative sterol carrier protein
VLPGLCEKGTRLSAFKDADEVYAYVGKMFELAVVDPTFVDATKNSDLVVLLTQTDPAATMLIDFPGHQVLCGDAVIGANSTVQLRMSSDNSNRFWQGKLNFTLAMAQRKVKLDGKRSLALKLLPLTAPLFANYRATLREAGRDDLVVD